MSMKIGIDVGGTFTDFLVAAEGRDPRIHKVLSTPEDPSVAVMQGLREIAETEPEPLSLEEFVGSVETVVHGTTVTTNATLTRNGACSGLLTTAGVRDALEMRRGIREEQYNNRYTNVTPLVPRRRRIGIEGRLDRNGGEITALDVEQVREAVARFREDGVEAVSICFLNAFANPAHEQAAAEIVRRELPGAYLTVSTDLLPSIRFYERVSTTALNSYVGPILERYLEQLTGRLEAAGFTGVLLIMQSNGGVMSPEVARGSAALTLLSGPAGGPVAGLSYSRPYGQERCIVTDMGGTSFEAALVDGSPVMVNDGNIDRLRIALPMLGIHTIGAGGGSVGWIDEGGLLRVGPQSAGADPGPACYGQGGERPCTTDANLVLGFLNPEYFAGGRMHLDVDAARAAIHRHVGEPLGLEVAEAAAGIYRVACTNMAQGVREITIKRGFDPREFPLVAAGGAGPLHSCLICDELGIPLQIIPRSSSILCASGMLLSDLKHDFVRTFVAPLAGADWSRLQDLVGDMQATAGELLAEERIPEMRREYHIKLDCRYRKQYHEVSFTVPRQMFEAADVDAIARAFHAEHNRLYGYSLEEQAVPVEIINVRLQALGRTDKLGHQELPYGGADAAHASKGKRPVYVFEQADFADTPVYDGHRLTHGNHVTGPAMIEQETTAIFVSAGFDCVIDRHGSFALYRKGREELVAAALHGGKHDR